VKPTILLQDILFLQNSKANRWEEGFFF